MGLHSHGCYDRMVFTQKQVHRKLCKRIHVIWLPVILDTIILVKYDIALASTYNGFSCVS